MTNEEFIESIKLDGEEWRTTTVSDRYAVSNYGRVLSYAISYPSSKRVFSKGPNLVKPRINKLGYYRVSIYSGNHVSKSYLVHRLVAMAFIPNPNNLPYINHKDENKLNNNVDNLEWCNSKYNNNYGTRNKRMSKTKTNNTYNIKSVQCIETGIIYTSTREAERQTGIDNSQISAVCNHKKNYKTAGGYHWKYIERSDE